MSSGTSVHWYVRVSICASTRGLGPSWFQSGLLLLFGPSCTAVCLCLEVLPRLADLPIEGPGQKVAYRRNRIPCSLDVHRLICWLCEFIWLICIVSGLALSFWVGFRLYIFLRCSRVLCFYTLFLGEGFLIPLSPTIRFEIVIARFQVTFSFFDFIILPPD